MPTPVSPVRSLFDTPADEQEELPKQSAAGSAPTATHWAMITRPRP